MHNTKQTQEQIEIADYNAYLELKKHYTNEDIANYMGYTNQQLQDLIAKCAFDDDKER